MEDEDWKSLRAVVRWPGRDLYIERVDAMVGGWVVVDVVECSIRWNDTMFKISSRID